MIQCQAVWTLEKVIVKKKQFVHFEFQINIYALVEQKSLQLEWKVCTPGKKLYKLETKKITAEQKFIHLKQEHFASRTNNILDWSLCTWKWNRNFYTSKNLYTWSRNCSKHQENDLSKGKNCFDKKEIVLSTRGNAPSKEKCSEKGKKF